MKMTPNNFLRRGSTNLLIEKTFIKILFFKNNSSMTVINFTKHKSANMMKRTSFDYSSVKKGFLVWVGSNKASKIIKKLSKNLNWYRVFLIFESLCLMKFKHKNASTHEKMHIMIPEKYHISLSPHKGMSKMKIGNRVM